jgi:lysophospholipase L1-like esterase
MPTQCIALLGDSLTCRFAWAEALPDCKIHNFGIDGDTTDDVLARLHRVIAAAPHKIFLQIGINDLLGSYSPTSKDTMPVDPILSIIADKHQRIRHDLTHALPGCVVHVCSLLPIACRYDPHRLINRHIRLLNGMLKESAVPQGFPFIDLYGKMADAHGGLAEKYDQDGVHLLPAAYTVWLDAIRPFL